MASKNSGLEQSWSWSWGSLSVEAVQRQRRQRPCALQCEDAAPEATPIPLAPAWEPSHGDGNFHIRESCVVRPPGTGLVVGSGRTLARVTDRL